MYLKPQENSMRAASDKLPVTVVIPTKNEAANLPRCLSALGRFSEVVVVDSGSTDDTVKIARGAGATVLTFKWDGHFPKKRNWCLQTHRFRTEWVLFLDADERVTAEFVRELERSVARAEYHAYWVKYDNYFMGKLLKHGDRMKKMALLRLGSGQFEPVDEDHWSTLDMEVHEHLLVDGKVGRMKSSIVHDDDKGLRAYYDRHNCYSSWEASRTLAVAGRNSPAGLTFRQRLKYRLARSMWFPVAYFFAAYVLKFGFLDGAAGLRFNLSKMFYFYQINFKIAELESGGEKKGRAPAEGGAAQNSRAS
jgi:glycosyltransferase involved in cell wall biosynthesis